MVELSVLIIIKQVPLELLVIVPLVKLTDIAAHKHKLLTRVSKHITDKSTHTLELLLIAAGHFIDKRTLSVNNLIMRNRKNKVLRKRINKTERELILMPVSPQRIFAKIGKRVVHPAHIPLIVKAKTVILNRVTRNVCPRSTLLGNHHSFGVQSVHSGVELLEEINGNEVLSSAVLVRNPLAVLAVIVKVKH